MRPTKYQLLLLATSALFSCEQLGSIDDIEPENVLTEKSLFVDVSSTEAVVNGMYKTWRSQAIGDMRNCMFMLAGECERSSFSDMGFMKNEVDVKSTFVDNYYSKLYLIVNQANTLIAGLSNYLPKGLEEERRNEILGEAYFNRAFANMMLLKSFGEFWDQTSPYGIVLYDKPVLGNTSKGRASVKESFKFISADVERAISLAPEFSGKSFYATRTAAKALKARKELYCQEYEKAIATCEDIISTGAQFGLELEQNYLDIFRNKFSSSEPILTVYTEYPYENIETEWGYPSVFYDQGAYIDVMLCQVADSLVGQRWDWEWGEPEGLDQRFYQTFFDENQEYGWYTTLKKYPLTDGVDDNTYYFIRLAEIYLIKAEAEARIGRYDAARKSLKPITDRGGYPNDYVDNIVDSDLLRLIFEHKYVELCAENYESWYDIVRYHILDGEDFSRYKKNLIVKLTHLNLPIPYHAISGNGALVQNPSYVYAYEE